MGPVLRAAFAGREFATVEPLTVIRLRDPADRDLIDLVAVLDADPSALLDIQRVSELTTTGSVRSSASG